MSKEIHGPGKHKQKTNGTWEFESRIMQSDQYILQHCHIFCASKTEQNKTQKMDYIYFYTLTG